MAAVRNVGVKVRTKYSTTHDIGLEMAVMTCPIDGCYIAYAIPERLRADAQKQGNGKITWYCPNGHLLGFYGKSDVEKERDDALAEAERAKQRARWAREDAAAAVAERDQAKADARAQKARGTRFKNERDKIRRRIAAGECPCCGRNFRQVRIHMAMMHPEDFKKFKEGEKD